MYTYNEWESERLNSRPNANKLRRLPS